jgi:hypothetical protein
MEPQMFIIEKNVPIPCQYPFEKMEIGDSFLVSPELADNVRRSATQRKKFHKDFNYTTKKEGDKIRVWRIPI